MNDEVYDEIPGFEVKKGSYKKSGQTADTAIPFYGTEDLKIIPTHTQLLGSITPEAFLIYESGSRIFEKSGLFKNRSTSIRSL